MAERGGPEDPAASPAGPEIRPEDNTQTAPGAAPAAAASPTPKASKHETPWTPPMEFDEFRLEKLLGQGGMGIVYLAQDVSLGRSVAVKFLASSEPDPTVLEYFDTEARTIARLQHPNVVTVFRVGSVGGHPYIVSEYVVGRSLSQLPRPLPWRRVLSIALGLARGLAAAHRQGILHRDVKPSNVIITESSEVKLLDFGLAERIDRSLSLRSLGKQTLAGTPRYMAPELLRGAPATPQSDLYSLGLTLYELCSGRLPPHALAQRMPEEAPPRVSVAAPSAEDTPPPIPREAHVDPDLAALIMCCLAPDPAERFASAHLLCEALERLEQPHVSRSLSATNPYRGMAPYEAEHRELFFGRGGDARAVLDRLRRQPLVLVVGDPGVGKSSLCRAGVLPRVKAETQDEGRDVTTVTLWPGRRPLRALASALAPLLDRKEAELVQALTDTPTWVAQALREAFPGRRGLLLFIDQLEELITLAEPAQAASFALFLGELALPSEGVRVLLAMRGNFLTSVGALPGLANEIERALYLLQPMQPEGVREAIIGPARSRGVVFESEDFIQTLIASTLHGAGSLPLLQFALAELWQRRDPAHATITRLSLSEMGGVAGALSRHADGVLARMSPAEQQAARRILVQLVTTGGMRVLRSEEELLGTPVADSRAALHTLAEGRLLHVHTEGGKARYEIAHDALMVSWGTLRNWLDDDIGHRAVRQRVEAASTEWERLSHAREVLWSQRQVDEARPLDPNTLTPRARAFLAASHRALRLQRWGRYLAGLAVLGGLAIVYGGLRLSEYLEEKQIVESQVATAKNLLADGNTHGEQARRLRKEALVLFDNRIPESSRPGKSSSLQSPWATADQLWSGALETLDQANEKYAQADQHLESALDRDRHHVNARWLRIQIAYERLRLAEDFHQQRPRDELQARLEQLLDNGTESAMWKQQLSAPAQLDLITDPPGAQIQISQYSPNARGVLKLEPIRQAGPTPIRNEVLPAGSYLLHITHPGRAPVDLPLLLSRGEHEKVPLALPVTVPSGYAYVPPGCFLLGTAEPEKVRWFLRTSPLHRYCISEGYLIGKTEVTFDDWVTYLDTLPPNARARHLLDEPHLGAAGAITLRNQPGTGWVFSLHHTREDVLTAREKEPFRYPTRSQRTTADWRRFPLSGVSAEDLKGFFYWLDRSGRLPGARLCNEYEWEHAARGADGRSYPHGDVLQPDDANIDTTYDRQPMDFGPDMVGSHPASASPFGLLDTSGNAFEITRPVTPELGRIVLRGGAWYYDQVVALSANRAASEPTQRDATIGVRVCASFSPGSSTGE
ncbi:bifunctional serine/threonine-protein kinase/formylglycine-generating enzyme family protein [Hyalangium versicolor]|uniref:bifunctional serine/threonine-protein kinase/formylglycine-generating enzyme family protein n=1 Tax=Hyalangium versicolor TaxID=2861190 RepID=UPI001CCF22C9|nr:bifunctional serine/threonine-protein kinase/formylglycine-generating enzyme family protein [Hyalangium versicolor]